MLTVNRCIYKTPCMMKQIPPLMVLLKELQIRIVCLCALTKWQTKATSTLDLEDIHRRGHYLLFQLSICMLYAGGGHLLHPLTKILCAVGRGDISPNQQNIGTDPGFSHHTAGRIIIFEP